MCLYFFCSLQCSVSLGFRVVPVLVLLWVIGLFLFFPGWYNCVWLLVQILPSFLYFCLLSPPVYYSVLPGSFLLCSNSVKRSPARRQGTLCSWRATSRLSYRRVWVRFYDFYRNKTYLQRICTHNWRLQCCLWHQWLLEFPINGASDYHWDYGDTRSPWLHTRFLDTGHM